jgi:hypothetical protein
VQVSLDETLVFFSSLEMSSMRSVHSTETSRPHARARRVRIRRSSDLVGSLRLAIMIEVVLLRPLYID